MTQTIYIKHPILDILHYKLAEIENNSKFPKINGYVIEAQDSDSKDKAYLEVSLAGYNPEDIDISIDSINSTITFEYSKPEVKVKDNLYITYELRELKQSNFKRSLKLSNAINLASEKHSFENGILKIEFDFKSDEEMGISKIKLG